jgi:hypothetical protein
MSSIARHRLFGRVVLSATLVAALSLSLIVMRPTEAQTTTQPSGETRQPIVDNQFTTTSGGALQARAPGNYIQQGIQVQTGAFDPFTGDAVQEPGFIRETIELIIEDFFDILISLVDSLNTLVGGNPLAGLFPGGTSSNFLTTGGMGSVPIN